MERKKQDNVYIKIYETMKGVHPMHNDRLWLAGRLLWYHQDDVSKVCAIIAKVNNWEDYDPVITERQVESVRRSKRSGSRSTLSFSSPYLQDVDQLATAFDWDTAQRRAFAKTERMNRCVKKDCYIKPDCYLRPCRWVVKGEVWTRKGFL